MARIISDEELAHYARCRETQRRLFPGDRHLLGRREPLTVSIGDIVFRKG